jgi:hypothetical protein
LAGTHEFEFVTIDINRSGWLSERSIEAVLISRTWVTKRGFESPTIHQNLPPINRLSRGREIETRTDSFVAHSAM